MDASSLLTGQAHSAYPIDAPSATQPLGLWSVPESAQKMPPPASMPKAPSPLAGSSGRRPKWRSHDLASASLTLHRV